MGLFSHGVELKSPEQLDAMRRAGLVVAQTLAACRERVAAGVSTAELDAIAEDQIRSRGASPSFLGYQGFPASVCLSVNDEVVHGIPGRRVLADGDLVSIDCGAIVDGWHGDAALTVGVGTVSVRARRLVEVTEEALWAGIAAARLGGRVRDISAAVEDRVRREPGHGIATDYVGHGIGSAMHQPPDVPNVVRRRRGPRLVAGLALAVEPMVTLGSDETQVLDDDWTVTTTDGSWAAHAEHTITVTSTGVWVLTALDGGEQHLRDAGIPFGGR